MRVLFFPSYIGGGFGHISRCLSLAQEMARRGWEIAFVVGGPHADLLSAGEWSVFRPSRPPLPARLWRRVRSALRGPQPSPAYLFFSDLNYQVMRDGFHNPRAVEQRVEWELDVVRRFDPDVLIGDTWLLTSIVGRLADLPVVQMIRAGIHPFSPQLVWWRPLPPQILVPQIASIFNPALERWGLPPVAQASELLEGDLFLVPSIPQLDPLPVEGERIRYVGPLTRVAGGNDAEPEWLSALPDDRPVVYVTIGGGADAVRGFDPLPLWEAAFADTDWEVVISTAGQPVPPHWRQRERLHVLPWAPGTAMIARADVVLFHGGYGTTMELVQAGTPAVVLPFHTEQESNGRRLEQHGAARVLAPEDEDLETLEGRFNDERFTYLACRRFAVRPREVRAAVEEVLCDAGYRTSARRLQRGQADFGGAALALELLADLGIL